MDFERMESMDMMMVLLDEPGNVDLAGLGTSADGTHVSPREDQQVVRQEVGVMPRGCGRTRHPRAVQLMRKGEDGVKRC